LEGVCFWLQALLFLIGSPNPSRPPLVRGGEKQRAFQQFDLIDASLKAAHQHQTHPKTLAWLVSLLMPLASPTKARNSPLIWHVLRFWFLFF